MMQELMAQLFQAVIISGIGAGFVGIILSGIYDFKNTSRRQDLARRATKRTSQPTVTVLVYVCNDAKYITECLERLVSSKYRHFDIVVVDNKSTDGSQRAVRQFLRTKIRPAIYFYAKRKRSTINQALALAYQKSHRGELVLVLKASSSPDQLFIKRAAVSLQVDPGFGGVGVSEYRSETLKISDLVPEIISAARHMYKKAASIFGILRPADKLNAAYTKAGFLAKSPPAVRYESSLKLMTRRLGGRPSGLVFGVFVLASLVVMTYAMVLAASLITYTPLLLAWLFVIAGSMALVWSNEASELMQKIQLTFTAPLLLFLWYVALFEFLLQPVINQIGRRYLPRIAAPILAVVLIFPVFCEIFHIDRF